MFDFHFLRLSNIRLLFENVIAGYVMSVTLLFHRCCYVYIVEFCTQAFQLTGSHLEPVSSAVPLVCGSPLLTYSLCQECHFRYKAEGRTPRPVADANRRRDAVLEDREKNAAFNKLMMAAPDLLSGANPSVEQGT